MSPAPIEVFLNVGIIAKMPSQDTSSGFKALIVALLLLIIGLVGGLAESQYNHVQREAHPGALVKLKSLDTVSERLARVEVLLNLLIEHNGIKVRSDSD